MRMTRCLSERYRQGNRRVPASHKVDSATDASPTVIASIMAVFVVRLALRLIPLISTVPQASSTPWVPPLGVYTANCARNPAKYPSGHAKASPLHLYFTNTQPIYGKQTPECQRSTAPLDLEPLQYPEQLISQWTREGELPFLEFGETDTKDCQEIMAHGLGRMVVVKSAQRWAVAFSNFAAVSTGTVVVTAITMLEEETDDCQRPEGTPQAQGIDIVA